MIRVQLQKRTKQNKRKGASQYWTLRWYGSDGRRYSESIGLVGEVTRNAAESRRREKEAKINAGQAPRDRPREITLGDFIEHDLAAVALDLKRDSRESIRHAGTHAKEALGENIPITKINQASIGKLKRYVIEERGCAPATLAKTLRTLKAMFNRAIEYGFLHENPFARVRMPKTQSRSKRVFSADEIGAMLDVASDPWLRAFVQLAVTSGLRKGELLNLLWQDIDFEGCAVRVAAKRAGTFAVPDRGEFRILEWTAKSYNERTVPLPEQTLATLMQLQEHGDESAYVFLSLDRLEKIDAELTGNGLGANYELMNNLAKRFRTLQREARTLLAERRGVEVKEVPWPLGSIHDLRRTYGTAMARVVPIHVLKEYMGHSKIDTTQAFYLAAETRDADTARETLSAFLTRGVTDRSRRTLDAPADSEPDNAESKNDKPLLGRGLRNEADGTRTRNHRIDRQGYDDGDDDKRHGPDLARPRARTTADRRCGELRVGGAGPPMQMRARGLARSDHRGDGERPPRRVDRVSAMPWTGARDPAGALPRVRPLTSREDAVR